jgi:transcriptional regulator with XRE-family HTH domain
MSSVRDRPELRAFARRLKRLRIGREWTQRDLARESGITGAGVAYYETARVSPQAFALAKLADALGVPMDYLWRGKGGGS